MVLFEYIVGGIILCLSVVYPFAFAGWLFFFFIFWKGHMAHGCWFIFFVYRRATWTSSWSCLTGILEFVECTIYGHNTIVEPVQ